MGLRKKTILIVDDDAIWRERLTAPLINIYDVVYAENGGQALDTIGQRAVDLVLLDRVLPDMDGIEILGKLRTEQGLSRADLPVILITELGGEDQIENGFNAGANDYIVKEHWKEKIGLRRIETVLELSWAWLKRDEVASEPPAPDGLFGNSVSWTTARDSALQLAAGDVPIFLTGEPGTGKSQLARLVHEKSPRKGGQFREINCSAIPTELLESELFGHEKGAFTHASRSHLGKFEQADGGTLFLDEVGELAPRHQAKLLQALRPQVRDGKLVAEISPIGSEKVKYVDVRIVAATNRDLRVAVSSGEFREDLFYRLGADAPIVLPPLRDRKEDFAELARRFLTLHGTRLHKTLKIDDKVLEKLARYSWPGNIAELEMEMHRAAVRAAPNANGKVTIVKIEDLSSVLDKQQATRRKNPQHGLVPDTLEELDKQLHDLEYQFFKRKKEEHQHNVASLARELRMKDGALRARLKKLKL
jgi:DNA-binding NtrC family response regulator